MSSEIGGEGLPNDMSGADAAEPRPKGLGALLTDASFYTGAAALLIAMACDAAAVVGRHIGAPLLGSIEIVQACIVVIASAAMVGATLASAHAGVHILLERLGPGSRAALQRFADLASAAFFACLIIGSVWLAWDLRDGQERTEVLHLPVAALRIVWCASAALVFILFLGRALFAARREHGDEP